MYLLILFHSSLFYPITLIDRKIAEKFQCLIHANQCVDTARSKRDINITIRRDELAFRNPGEIKQDFLGGRGRNESIPQPFVFYLLVSWNVDGPYAAS